MNIHIKPSDPVKLDFRSKSTGKAPVTVLHPRGTLDYRTYLDLIEASRETYDRGVRRLVIDLRDVTAIKLSGLFALHSVARLFAGEEMLDPESGWAGLCIAFANNHPIMPKHVTLLHPSPAVETVIRQGRLACVAAIVHDLQLSRFDL